MPILRAVLFDLDDTLTDRSRSIERLAAKFLEQYGAVLRDCEIGEVIREIHAGDGSGYASREDLGAHLQTALPWQKAPSVSQLVDFWRENFPRCNVERAGVTATLYALQHRGLKLGVISNGFSRSQRTKLEVLGIASLFSVTLISEEVGIKKPDQRIFQMALEELKVMASETIFIGDNLELDVRGSTAVGMRAMWLNHGEIKPPAGVIGFSSFTQLPLPNY